MENIKEKSEFENQKKKIEEINSAQKETFEAVPISERILFSSHCIRKDIAEQIESLAKELGYRYVKAGGGSIVRKKIEQENPKAVIGVACFREIEAIIGELKIPYQAVMLDQDGCKDTVVDIRELTKVMKMTKTTD